jgi:hypothetical protein
LLKRSRLELDDVDLVLVVDEVHLVQIDDDARHTRSVREPNVLARLRLRPIGRADDDDRTVHLRGARDQGLHVVGGSRHVDVRVATEVGLVLDVAHRDGDAALGARGRMCELVEPDVAREPFRRL